MRILVVEDEVDLNQLIVERLRMERYVVDSCFDGKTALDYLLMGDYGAAILDIMLPKMNGYEVLKQMHRENVYVPIMFLSARTEVDDVKKVVRRGGKEIHLTAKEFAILQYLVRNRDIVVSREQILSGVWDDGGEITSNVVDVYVRLLRKKLDNPFPFKMIQTVRGSGYCLRSKEER